MFASTNKFNQDLSSFDLSNVIYMDGMFGGTKAFNGNISTWKFPKLSILTYFLNNATAFNQDISNWDMSGIGNAANMFNGATSFNQDLSKWKFDNLVYGSFMFANATSFNGNVTTWKFPKAAELSGMFLNATSFNQDISNWEIPLVNSANNMFLDATSFNQDLSKWNTSKLEFAQGMFQGATSFNGDITTWDTRKLQYIAYMFRGAKNFDQDLSKWKITNVRDMTSMFTGCGLSVTNYSKFLIGIASQIPNISSNMSFYGTDVCYNSSAITAHNTLVSTPYSWWIEDGGIEPNTLPTIETISPSNGPTAGGTQVTITGTNFIAGLTYLYVTSPTTVTFGGISGTNVTVNSNGTQITVITPATNSYGSVDVIVTTNGGSATRNNGFTYQTLTISTIRPSFGYTSGQTDVTITGSNFHNGVNPLTVQFGSNNFGTVTDISPDGTTIYVTTPSNLNTGSVNVIITSDDGSVTKINGFVYAPVPCFHEDTLILTNNGYIPIKNLKKGDLIQTLNHAFVPISIIGHSQLYNPGNEERTKDRLYKCTKDAYPEITEDLILTGMHAILVNNYSNQVENKKNKKMANGNRKIENKCCLLACVDERTVPYNVEGTYTIYNLALEHHDENNQYGIYANGLLVETASQKYIKEMMTLIE